MAKWIFEAGHTAAEFRVRHMMVTWVRGHFKDVHGSLEFDPENATDISIEATIQAAKLWTGDPQRDEHLLSADFLDAETHPYIKFQSTRCERVGASDYKVSGDLTVRGMTRAVSLDLHFLGKWNTPYWTDRGDAGPVTRIGFVGQTCLNRHDFRVSWKAQMDNEGLVVGDEIDVEIDVEALLESEWAAAQAKGSS